MDAPLPEIAPSSSASADGFHLVFYCSVPSPSLPIFVLLFGATHHEPFQVKRGTTTTRTFGIWETLGQSVVLKKITTRSWHSCNHRIFEPSALRTKTLKYRQKKSDRAN